VSQVFNSVRRLQRSQERNREHQKLNLVPLMDVFTILVFFFLVQSAEVVHTEDRNLVSLPESFADQKPRQTVVVTLTKSDILLQGVPVALTNAVLASPDGQIESLVTALREEMIRSEAAAGGVNQAERELTIMGDKRIPFRLLRKVMLSCTRAGYERIALSVLQRSVREG